MTSDRDRYAAAVPGALRQDPALASSATEQITAELEFEIDAAIRTNDLGKVYALVPRLARLSITDLLVIRARLEKNFGRSFRASDFKKAIKEAQLEQKRAVAHSNSALPQIAVNNEFVRDLTALALPALRAANYPPSLFLRSGRIVHISIDERGRPSIIESDEHHLRGRLDRSANWVRSLEDGEHAIPVPLEVVRDIFRARPDGLGLPALIGITESPMLRPDGTILDQPGYDPASGMYYVPSRGFTALPVPEIPTVDDVDGALSTIEDAIGEFPFVDQTSRANLYGFLLTPILRPAIANACAPLVLIDAPKAGTGKSLLVDVFSLITTGRSAAMTPYPRNDEEMVKQIAASLLAGRTMVCFDNVEGTMGSPSLALALTAIEYEVRILGTQTNLNVPNLATWIATGNNIRPTGDMPRRCYRIRMDAKMSSPSLGREFKHANLRRWVSKNRARLLHSLLLIARCWFAAGRPNHVDRPLGSYEAWHRTVGSVLKHVGVEGFLGGIETYIAEADEHANEWEGFLLTLADYFPNAKPFTIAEAADKILSVDALKKVLPERLSDAEERKAGGLKRSLSREFPNRRDMRMGELGVHIRKEAWIDRNKIARWSIAVPNMTDATPP